MTLPLVAISIATTFPPSAELERETLPHPAMPIYNLRARDIEYRVHTFNRDRQDFRYTFSASYGFREPLRLAIVGEISRLSEQSSSGFHFLLCCPRAATASARTHHGQAVELLSSVIESEPRRLAQIVTTWLGDGERGAAGSLHLHATRFTRVSAGVQDGSPAYVEFTLHRYDHYVGKIIQREYNIIAHVVEPLHPHCLSRIGYISGDSSSTLVSVEQLQASLATIALY
ncbi:hypothetical protein MSAN_01024200 [Mycena sanguinolenta]|uniref:Uncharacterized protein n=1 Tax=Mycena sanguinolenta TaxID=230812 RepID=A0A8H6YPA3_9AGAR|nr:hypothetical protein MSAN_01024200 [Mycena sanguinolenta]